MMRLKLKFAMLTAGKTQHQLSEETGLSESRLSEIVRGWRNPREKDRAALASALGQPESRLFEKPATQTRPLERNRLNK